MDEVAELVSETSDVPSNANIRKHSPVVVQKLEDPLAQIAYICKFMWHRAESYVDTKALPEKPKSIDYQTVNLSNHY